MPVHMRTKKWARPELAVCPWYVEATENLRGTWNQRFASRQPLHLELGCGKGVSTAQMVRANPQINYIAMDISPDVLGDARRNIAAAWGEVTPPNVCLCRGNIEQIGWYIAPEDGVERVYINFCNPWPRPRHQKRRLTHPRQLIQYRQFLTPGGEVWFKTDDADLYADSLIYFETAGYEPVYRTEDLHASGFAPNYISEHEARFSQQGIPTRFGIFRKTDAVIDREFTRWELDRSAADNNPPENQTATL